MSFLSSPSRLRSQSTKFSFLAAFIFLVCIPVSDAFPCGEKAVEQLTSHYQAEIHQLNQFYFTTGLMITILAFGFTFVLKRRYNERVRSLLKALQALDAHIQESSISRPRVFMDVSSKELSLDEKFIQKVTTVIQSNISNPGFSVEQIASEVHLSRTQLCRKLKAASGLAPNELINEMRLQKAAVLILAKADTLAQICYAVGFNEPSYFAKRFKRKFGVPPSEYQDKIGAKTIAA